MSIRKPCERSWNGFYMGMTEEVDDVQPAPLGNPFLDVPIGLVSKVWAFVLLGNPGIGEQSSFLSHHSHLISNVGKTAFLYVLLVLRLQARLPTIYQSRDTHLYYFADNGVFLIHLLGTRGHKLQVSVLTNRHGV
jgi:hypothetical protein